MGFTCFYSQQTGTTSHPLFGLKSNTLLPHGIRIYCRNWVGVECPYILANSSSEGFFNGCCLGVKTLFTTPCMHATPPVFINYLPPFMKIKSILRWLLLNLMLLKLMNDSFSFILSLFMYRVYIEGNHHSKNEK